MADKEQVQQSKLVLSANALESLGINKQPFAGSVLSDKEIYFDSTFSQLIDQLKHHLQFSPLLLIVEGEFGTGKTTLFRHVSQSEVPNIKLLPVSAEASDTLMQIQHKMSIHLEDLGSANYLDNNLKQLATFDTIPALIIDDAHTLSDTVIQELIRYQTELKTTKETELKILLIANPGMSETIEKITELDHNQLYVQSMPVFNEKQILNFCQHRLLASGYSGQPLLDSNNAQQILKKSAGNPLRIMEVSVAILEKKLKKQTAETGPLVKKLIPAAAIIIILTGLGFYALQTMQQKTPAPVTQVAPVLQKPEPVPVITESQVEVEIDRPVEAVVDDTEELVTTVDNNIEEPVTQDTLETPAATPAIPAQPTEPQQPSQPAIAEQPAAPAQPAEPEQPVIAASQYTDIKKEVKPTDVQSTSEIKLQTKTVSQKKEITDKVRPAIHPSLTKLGQMGIHDSQWLLQQNASHWTLQILGARDPETLLKFAQQHKLGNDTAWYETQLSGKPWYVMVHRFYTSKDIARASVSRLPAPLQKARPWVKSVESIHQAIK